MGGCAQIAYLIIGIVGIVGIYRDIREIIGEEGGTEGGTEGEIRTANEEGEEREEGKTN